jgi:hypothetical protein
LGGYACVYLYVDIVGELDENIQSYGQTDGHLKTYRHKHTDRRTDR